MAAEPARFGEVAAYTVERLKARAQAASDGTLPRRPDLREPSISQRLQRKFGLGEQPLKRQALYRQLEILHDQAPEEVLRIISEAVVGAAGAREPGRYFCVAVKKKLAAAGLTIHSSEAVGW